MDKPKYVTEDSLIQFKDEIIHQFHIFYEDVIDRIKIVAEGVSLLDEKIDRRTQELEKKIDDTQQMMGVMYRDLNNKISETGQRLDKKIDETKKELKADILKVDEKVDLLSEKLEQHEKVMHNFS